eukprot:scaffold6073_cov169-Amphora_coffeaeformis.AAC.3
METTTVFRKRTLQLSVAVNVEEARYAYELLEQAQFVLQPPSNDDDGIAVQLPPFYGTIGPPCGDDSTTTRVATAPSNVDDTDDDEWLELSTLEWTLQDILKAEKITERLLQVHAWGNDTAVSTWTPSLAQMAKQIKVEPLQRVLREITGAIEIVRVKTVMDPTGKSSFVFRLSDEAFPVLRMLKAKEADLVAKVNRQPKFQDQLDALREELQEKEDSIRMGLCRAIADHRAEIDAGLSVIAELDVVLAKAAFGIVHRGVIPIVKHTGIVNVASFVHPLIVDRAQAVPVDLRLACGDGDDDDDDDDSESDHPRALVISGPNGGGKTLAMKSFGLVSQMVKLGIPVPTESPRRPVVGFFDSIITALGDRQSVTTGQSTFMAQLSSYAGILETVGNSESQSPVLVLLDELGSGTEADGGGAIGQAILEHMLEISPNCCAVATTHSSRLKAISFNDERFTCATVMLEEYAGVRQPTYRLEYGLIGESFALEAAARSQPALPDSVLKRAAELCRPATEEDASDRAYLQALTESLEKQKNLSITARKTAEAYVREMAACRAAMIQLASQYDRQMGYWESRVTNCFEKLQAQNVDSLELLGTTLDELRVTRQQIQSTAERLKERGLRLVPSDYALSTGEYVVVVDNAAWDGAEGSVVSSQDNEVVLSVAISPFEPSQTVTLARHQVAIWDYDSVFDDASGWDMVGTSRQDSQQRLSGLLSSLGSSSSSKPSTNSNSNNSKEEKSFTSSRQRKAAKKRRTK